MKEEMFLLALKGMNEVNDLVGLDIPKLLAHIDKVKVSNVSGGEDLNWGMALFLGGSGAALGFLASLMSIELHHEDWSPLKRFTVCGSVAGIIGTYSGFCGLLLQPEPITP